MESVLHGYQKKLRQEEIEKEQRQNQDRAMSGERERIEFGIDTLGPEQVVAWLKLTMKTAEGRLRTVASIFPESVMHAIAGYQVLCAL
jgi:hypothetical protein